MVALPHYDDDTNYMTEAEYLEFEENSDMKHEFSGGQVFAMTGGSLRHNKVCFNTGRVLGNQLVDKNCDIVLNDTRVKVESKKVSYRYPDITIICGKPEMYNERTDTVTNPILLVEVLSPSTEIDDRNDKLEEYLQIESLQEYLLISQDKAKIEQYVLKDGDWVYHSVTGLEGKITLPSINCELSLEDVYLKIEFE